MSPLDTDRSAGRRRWHLPFSILDVKLAARMLLKHPLLTVVSVLSLGVGIPMGLAPAHALDALEAPLPVERGDRVMGLRYWSTEHLQNVPSTAYDFSVWSESLRSFDGLAAVRRVEYNLDPGTGTGRPVSGAEVTGSAFPVLRVRPLLGRALGPADDAANAPPVVVLGHDLWQSRFAGDPGVVGRIVRIQGAAHTVVGVMPEGFLFPIRQEMWLPLRERPASEPGQGVPLQVFGRLAEGVTPDQAAAELGVVGQRLRAEFPRAYEHTQAQVVPFTIASQGVPRGGWRSYPGTWIIQVGAMFLLLVACTNVGLLIFARTASRSAELTVRAALGAERGRIVAQVFVEVLLLAILSTVVGLLLIELVGDRLLATSWTPSWGDLPWWVDLGVTPKMVIQALLLAIFSAAAASIIPTLRVTGRNLQESLRRAAATGVGVRLGPLASALIVIDMALAVVVVGLVVGVSERLDAMTHQSPDLAANEFLTAEITLSELSQAPGADTLSDPTRAALVARVQRALVERLQGEGRVRGVAVASVLPRMEHFSDDIEVQGGTGGPLSGTHEAKIAFAAPGFFAGLGQRMIAGRDFNDADVRGEQRTVIVNRSFVERALGGSNAVGRQIRVVLSADGKRSPWFEIVGVVPDLEMAVGEPHGAPGVYHPAAAGAFYPIWLAIRVGPDPASFAPRLHELASELGPTVTVARIAALDQVFPDTRAGLIGLRIGWTVFLGILLVLAVSGMYTIMALTVRQRTREIGIRTALGARPGHVVATIGRRAAIQLGIGALLGMPLAGWIFFQVQDQYDASTPGAFVIPLLPGVIAVLLIGLLACTAPLLRALRIPPTVAMRSET